MLAEPPNGLNLGQFRRNQLELELSMVSLKQPIEYVIFLTSTMGRRKENCSILHINTAIVEGEMPSAALFCSASRDYC